MSILENLTAGNSKLEEPRNNEQMKSGIRRQESNRLEEEVFSDAVAEFGDAGTSPAVETSVGTGAGEPDVNVEANERQLTLSVKASSGTSKLFYTHLPIINGICLLIVSSTSRILEKKEQS